MDFKRIIGAERVLKAIYTVEMHTSGGPVRIIHSGYNAATNNLKTHTISSGQSLLEQRTVASKRFDWARRRLLLEPRGHADMFGAILRQDTELTAQRKAHIGVLFADASGYGTMCGHATLALGRFLVDTHDPAIFPRRKDLVVDLETLTTKIDLHAPCGIVEITVPIRKKGNSSDPSRPVSFLSVPCYAVALSLEVHIPEALRWYELRAMGKESVKVDLSYGGAFYAIVSATELGFDGLSREGRINIDFLSMAAKIVKETINSNPLYAQIVKNANTGSLEKVWSVLIKDEEVGDAMPTTGGAETGLCFFGEEQLDRSPTGSGVGARMAVGFAKGTLKVGDSRTYHSLLSNRFNNKGFVGRIESTDGGSIIVRTEAQSWYTGSSTFIIEDGDAIGKRGFTVKDMTSPLEPKSLAEADSSSSDQPLAEGHSVYKHLSPASSNESTKEDDMNDLSEDDLFELISGKLPRELP